MSEVNDPVPQSSELKLAMKIIAWCADKFRYYVVFSKSILFMLGLIFSYKLVEKAFFDILITHLPDNRKEYDMRKAAIFVNLQGGTEAVLQICFGFLADAYTGLYRMVVCSTTLCIIGLLLSCFASSNSDSSLELKVFYLAQGLMTLSQAAIKVTLKAFLGDQMLPRDQPANEEEEERAKKCSKFWWYSVSLLAAVVALSGPSRIDKLKVLSMVLAIAMGAAFLCFLLGTKFYTRLEPTGSSLSDVVFVTHSAIIKRNVEYPRIPEQLFKNSSGLVQILPHVSWLRWLDRAAVVVQEQEEPGGIFTVEQVKGVKFLLKMLPMWTAFLTFSLVAASGSTFFLEEATSIANENFPFLFFINLERFVESVVSEVSDFVLEKLGKKNNNNVQRMMLVRIGIGMVCCVLCCIAAWTNALHSMAHREHMSVFWLTPQYLLLAVMEGLAHDGLGNFFDSQVSKPISRYGPPFGECVTGVGKFLSVVCILILDRWFKWFEHTVQDSRLDKYYAMLAILSSINIILYCLVAHWYGDDSFLSEYEVDIEMADSVQADQQLDSLGYLVSRSLSGKGKYSQRSFSARIAPIPEDSSGNDPTEETDSRHSEKQEDSSLPLTKLETGQETTLSSSIESPDNTHVDHEAETLKHDVVDTDQVSPLASESTMNGLSDAPLLNKARSFPRVSSRGIRKRFNSMH